MRTRAVLFDLDGTLVDSLEDIAESMNFVLCSMGFPEHSSSVYRSFVGDGVGLLARRALPQAARDDATIAACVARMREVYRERFLLRTRPYPGIAGLLDALAARGLRLAVLSNKPDDLTVALVAALFGKWHFDPVFGERAGVPRKPDPSGALEVAARLGVAPASVVYLGDTPTDVRTALAAGMKAVGVAWGFRDAAELAEAGATAVLSSPIDALTQIDA